MVPVNPTPALILNDVEAKLNDKTIFSDINLTINKSEIFGVVGISGSGKSVLMEVMTGTRTPTKGKVEVYDGEGAIPVFQQEKKSNSLFGISPQKNSFYEDLTVKENLEYFGSLYDLSSKALNQNIMTAISLVELENEKDTLAGILPAGLKRKLDFACALVHNPKILVLDFPTSNLDFVSKKQIWKLIRRINHKGTTIILSSSSLEEVEMLCDRIVIMHLGKKIFLGPIDELRKYYSTQEQVVLITEDKDYRKVASLLKKVKGIKILDIVIDKEKLVVYSPEASRLMHFIIHATKKLGKKIIELDFNKPTLDDVFISICRKE